MKRRVFMQQLWFSLVIVAMLAGDAWANLSGSANLLQITEPKTVGVGGGSSIFLPTEPILIQALYYDPNPACVDVAPVFVQLFVFNGEGKFLAQFDGTTSPSTTSLPGSTVFGVAFNKYRVLQLILPPLVPGDYRFAFLVRTCDNNFSAVTTEFTPFRVTP